MPPTSSKRRIWGLTTGTLCLVLWLLLSGGDGPGFALAAALVAGVSAAALTPASLPSIAFLPALGFIGFFLRQSLLGGVDVAQRAMRRRLPLEPAWIDYRTRLETAPARNLFMLSMSLMPGTLAARDDGDTIRVHLLDPAMQRDLPTLEQAVVRIFRDEPAGRE